MSEPRNYNFGWVVALTVLVLSLVLGFFMDRGMRKAQEEADASWTEWHAQRMAEGCRIESYLSVYRAVRPVWRCPDGRAELGRVQ